MDKQELKLQAHDEYVRKYIEAGEKFDEAIAPILGEYEEAIQRALDELTHTLETLGGML